MKEINSFTKDQVAEYSLSGEDFPKTVLDMSKPIKDLRDEVLAMQNAGNGGVNMKDAITMETVEKYIKNKTTGHIFVWTQKLHDHLADAYVCDKDGNRI